MREGQQRKNPDESDDMGRRRLTSGYTVDLRTTLPPNSRRRNLELHPLTTKSKKNQSDAKRGREVEGGTNFPSTSTTNLYLVASVASLRSPKTVSASISSQVPSL